MQVNPDHWQRNFSIAAAVALSCFLSGKLAESVLNFGIHASPVWFPAGVALAAVWLFGRWAAVGVFTGMAALALSMGASPLLAIVAAAGNTAGAIAGKLLLRRIQFRPFFDNLQDVLGFLALAVILSPVVNATISSFNAPATEVNSWETFVIHWGVIWLGDSIGILVVTPLLLVWLSRPIQWVSVRSLWRQWRTSPSLRSKAREVMLWLVLLVGVSWVVFQCPTQADIAHYPLEYLPFPLIIWAALRLGPKGTVLGSLLVSSIAIGGAVQQGGPFVTKANGDPWQAILFLQVFVGIITATALVLAAAVTERQQTEERLRKSEERFRSMFEAAAIGIGMDDIQGRFIDSNPALQAMLGYSREELSRMSFADFTHPEDRVSERTLFQELVAGQRNSYQVEARQTRKDGQPIWVRLTNSLVRDGEGNPRFTIGMVEDISGLKQAQEGIRLYADIINRMQMGLIVWQLRDLDDLNSFRLIDINPAARHILQIKPPPTELVGQTMQVVFPCLMESAFPGIYANVIRSGKVRDLGEVCYGDSVVPAGIYATKAFPLPNQCVGLVFEDITERKQAEDALQQSEARFRVIAETAACAVLVYQGPRLRYANPATERITEYSQAELLAIDFWELAHPDYRELVKQRGLGRQKGEAVPNRYELKILTKTGKERWIDFTAGVISYEGKPAGIATAYDITDRKQAEEKLILSANVERLFSQIASRIQSSLDLETVLRTTVEEVRSFLQADRVFISCFKPGGCQAIAESVAPPWSSILGWETDGDRVEEVKAMFQTSRLRVINDTSQIERSPFLAEYYDRCQVKAGMGVSLMIDGEMYGVLIANQCSAPRQWQPFEIELLEQLATPIEITIKQRLLYHQVQTFATDLERQVEERTAELQQRMLELQTTNQVKDLLLHAVSHDLRTPVQGMLMVLNRLRGKCGENETVPMSRFMLDCMLQSSNDQLQLLNSLRDDHLADEASFHLNCKPFNLHAILQEALVTLHQPLEQNQVQLCNQVSADLPPVYADGILLRQVLESLLSNAIKHNLPGVTVSICSTVMTPNSTSPALLPQLDVIDAPCLYTRISDTGKGLTSEQCDRLFKPYVRSLDNPHRTGIGLGLHRCRQIIHASKGQIGVESEPDRGTTVWFTLPLASSAAHPDNL